MLRCIVGIHAIWFIRVFQNIQYSEPLFFYKIQYILETRRKRPLFIIPLGHLKEKICNNTAFKSVYRNPNSLVGTNMIVCYVNCYVVIDNWNCIFSKPFHSGESLFPNICGLPLLLFFWLKWAGYPAVEGLNLLAQTSDRTSPFGV